MTMHRVILTHAEPAPAQTKYRTWDCTSLQEAQEKLKDVYFQLLRNDHADLERPAMMYPTFANAQHFKIYLKEHGIITGRIEEVDTPTPTEENSTMTQEQTHEAHAEKIAAGLTSQQVNGMHSRYAVAAGNAETSQVRALATGQTHVARQYEKDAAELREIARHLEGIAVARSIEEASQPTEENNTMTESNAEHARRIAVGLTSQEVQAKATALRQEAQDCEKYADESSNQMNYGLARAYRTDAHQLRSIAALLATIAEQRAINEQPTEENNTMTENTQEPRNTDEICHLPEYRALVDAYHAAEFQYGIQSAEVQQIDDAINALIDAHENPQPTPAPDTAPGCGPRETIAAMRRLDARYAQRQSIARLQRAASKVGATIAVGNGTIQIERGEVTKQVKTLRAAYRSVRFLQQQQEPTEENETMTENTTTMTEEQQAVAAVIAYLEVERDDQIRRMRSIAASIADPQERAAYWQEIADAPHNHLFD